MDELSLYADFARGDPEQDVTQYVQPAARFVRPDIIRSHAELAWKPGRLFLGVVDGVPQTDDATDETFIMGGKAIGVSDPRHVITFAGSRAGKGRSAIIPNMLHYPGSVLVTDPKGELATITARRRHEMGQTVRVLDPFGVAHGFVDDENLRVGFNPIEAMSDLTLVEDAALIADAIVIAKTDSKDPHWDESARAFIEGVVLHVRTCPLHAHERNLVTVRRLIAEANNGTLEADMVANDAKGTAGIVKIAAAEFFERPPNERGSVLSNARRQLKFIDLMQNSRYGNTTLCNHGFDLDALKTSCTTVYLCLPARFIGLCNRWLRLFVNLTLQSMEKTKVKTMPGNAPVLCVLDEFASLGHVQQIEDAAAQIAGFGVRLWPILQDMTQLKALYGARWETFVANAGILQFFGNSDLTTLGWISARCGSVTINNLSFKPTHSADTKAGRNNDQLSLTVQPLMTAEEAARYFGMYDLQRRELIILAGRKRPFLVLQRAFYDKHQLFKTAAGVNLYDDL